MIFPLEQAEPLIYQVMNSTINFMPNGENDRAIWLHNFSTKLPGHALALGITVQEAEAVQKDAAMFSYILSLLEMCRQTTIMLTGYKNLMKHARKHQHLGALPVMPALPPPESIPEGIFDRISKLAGRIKASPNYNASVGHDLGIIAPRRNVDLQSLQPKLRIILMAGQPQISCIKGKADGIDLYVDRNDGAGFVLINRLLRLKYLDTTILPAGGGIREWSYRAIYVKRDRQVGHMSAVVSVVVKEEV